MFDSNNRVQLNSCSFKQATIKIYVLMALFCHLLLLNSICLLMIQTDCYLCQLSCRKLLSSVLACDT